MANETGQPAVGDSLSRIVVAACVKNPFATGQFTQDLGDVVARSPALGLELALQLKQNPKTRATPIIMVSARGEEEDRIRGLETGADDYIAKPFSPREMVARVNAVLRRSRPETPSDQIEIGGLRIDSISHRVTANGQRLEIAPTEFRLLHYLMSHAERAFTRSQLLDQVWGEQIYVEERTVDVHVRRLRKSLEDTGHDSLLQTVRGIGYRFSDKP